MTGHYDEHGAHICVCGTATRYASFSGGREFYCPGCGMDGRYPDGEGGPRARLLTQGAEGVAELRRQMQDELARRTAE